NRSRRVNLLSCEQLAQFRSSVVNSRLRFGVPVSVRPQPKGDVMKSCVSKGNLGWFEGQFLAAVFSRPHFQRRAVALLAICLMFATWPLPGPPLIFHSIFMYKAKSLPWTSKDWIFSGKKSYNVKKLLGDTLAILNPATPVLVRMETLR